MSVLKYLKWAWSPAALLILPLQVVRKNYAGDIYLSISHMAQASIFSSIFVYIFTFGSAPIVVAGVFAIFCTLLHRLC